MTSLIVAIVAIVGAAGGGGILCVFEPQPCARARVFILGFFVFVWVIVSLSISSEIICCPLSPEYDARGPATTITNTTIARILIHTNGPSSLDFCFYLFTVWLYSWMAVAFVCGYIERERACAHELHWPFISIAVCMIGFVNYSNCFWSELVCAWSAFLELPILRPPPLCLSASLCLCPAL